MRFSTRSTQEASGKQGQQAAGCQVSPTSLPVAEVWARWARDPEGVVARNTSVSRTVKCQNYLLRLESESQR